MSLKSAKAFLERMKTDEDFCRGVRVCKDTEARMTFVQSQGFDFTGEELGEVRSELAEEELDWVAGGLSAPCDPFLGDFNCSYYRQ